MKSIQINQQSSKPIYQQLYDQIASQIIRQELSKGTKLPSIRSAAKELRVSIITIKKTWEMLESERFIYTVQGKGAYVADIKADTLPIKKWHVVDEDLVALIHRCKSLGISKSELIELIHNKY